MKGESYYLKLFQDLKANEKQWFEDILTNVYNMSLCDLLVVTLGTLASLLRNRNEIEKAGEVLAFDKRILDIYENIVNTPDLVDSFTADPQNTVNNLRGLQYKYRNIMYPIYWTGICKSNKS